MSMLIYFSMFLIPVIAQLFPIHGDASVKRLGFLLIGIYFTILIGFRYEVGGDWFPYLNSYEKAYGSTLFEYLSFFGWRDIGYFSLNWLSAQIGGGIILVNMVCGGIATLGLVAFCRRSPLPWSGIAIGVSYFLVVVAMGFTRQSVAMGLFFLILSKYYDQSIWRSLILALIAGLFHLSALIIILIFALSYSGKRRLMAGSLTIGIAIFLGLVFNQYLQALWYHYVISGALHSEGGFIRVLMTAMPALLLLVFRNRLFLEEKQRSLWITMAVLALLCIPAVFVASTAVDRIALYLLPLQIFVFTRIHRLFMNSCLRATVILIVIFYYGFVLWIWLNYAIHAEYWLPYKFALFQDGAI